LSEINLSDEAYNNLLTFLKNREYDIAVDFEDFGLLKDVFHEVFGREPQEET